MSTRLKQLVVPVKGGNLVATSSPDPNYPGIDVEFLSKYDIGNTASRPRVLIEQPSDSLEVRALIWDNPDSEDYTNEITLCHTRRKVQVRMYPAIGNAFEVTLYIPYDEDTAEFIENFIKKMFQPNFIETYVEVN